MLVAQTTKKKIRFLDHQIKKLKRQRKKQHQLETLL